MALPDSSPVGKKLLGPALKTCLAGPEEEWYWNAWDTVLRYGCIRLGNRYWRLYQDGDVFAVEASSEGDDWLANQAD